MYVLDTNICIYAMKGTYPCLNKKLMSIDMDDICISSITVSELEYGAEKSNWKARSREIMRMFLSNYMIVPFTEKDAIASGRVRANLAAKGTPIGLYDVMIAGQAIAREWTVVTHNTKEFVRVSGLRIEDWTEPTTFINLNP